MQPLILSVVSNLRSLHREDLDVEATGYLNPLSIEKTAPLMRATLTLLSATVELFVDIVTSHFMSSTIREDEEASTQEIVRGIVVRISPIESL